MKEGRWFQEDREPFIKSLSSLFRVSERYSVRSKASQDREADINTLLSRIANQLYTYEEQGLPWRTPDDWDNSLMLINGGQSCRRSKSILNRISWDSFISKCDKLLENRLDF